MYRRDPELRTIKDDIKLTYEQAVELKHCAADIIYFAKYCQIISANGQAPIQLKKYQIKVLRDLVSNDKKNNILLMFRQSGKTTLLAIYALWYAMFNKDQTIGILANKCSQSYDLINRLKIMYHNLPLWLQTGLDLSREGGVWTKDSVRLANGSHIFAAAAYSSAIRGKTINLMIVDEFAFLQPDSESDFMNTIFPTICSAHNSKLVLASSPHGMNSFYKIWQNAVNEKNNFKPTKITVFDDEEKMSDPNWLHDMEIKYGIMFSEQEFKCTFLDSSINKEAKRKERRIAIINKINDLLIELSNL